MLHTCHVKPWRISHVLTRKRIRCEETSPDTLNFQHHELEHSGIEERADRRYCFVFFWKRGFVGCLFVLILVDLTRNHHHPNREHGSDDPECENGLPALTSILLLQPRQRLHIRAPLPIIEHKPIAQIIDIRAPEQLNRRAHNPRYKQHE